MMEPCKVFASAYINRSAPSSSCPAISQTDYPNLQGGQVTDTNDGADGNLREGAERLVTKLLFNQNIISAFLPPPI
jgi:hypothetical protein